jgi:predicted AlkP superfamily pyrophosphatase or phosphodiesterase
MNNIKVVLFCILVLFIHFSVAAQSENKPRLVVGIVLENFNPDYLIKYKTQFGEGGFSRLLNNGLVYRNSSYDYMYSQTGVDHASIYSGTNPSYHGIISHSWYDRMEGDAISNVFDKKVRAVGSDSIKGKVSPKKLLAHTIGDELKLTNACSRVFGVSMNPEAAVLSTGHMADGAFWLDELSGKWATSSYYMDSLYNWIKDYNKKVNPEYYVNRGWFPLSDEEANIASTKIKHRFGLSDGFYYDLSKSKKKSGSFRMLKATPYANSMITDFARELVINENLGKDADADLLSLSYSFMDYMGDEFSTNSAEKIDMMHRLDKELGKLFDFLDEQVGMENVLVFVTVSQAMVSKPEELKRYRLPGSYFNTFKAIALLKPYLNITYGVEDWISSYDSQQIFLDRQLIERKGKNLKEMQDRIADFLIQFSGIYKVIPSYALRTNIFPSGIESSMQKSFNQ